MTREEAINQLRSYEKTINKLTKAISEQEPKTGHWKPYLKEGLRYQCSACDSRFDTSWEYCPRCGARMVEPQEGSEQNKCLDKIRAEIEELDTYYDNDYFVGNNDAMFKCDEVMQIIDKYRGG